MIASQRFWQRMEACVRTTRHQLRSGPSRFMGLIVAVVLMAPSLALTNPLSATATDPRMTGRIDWTYTRTETFAGHSYVLSTIGYTLASLARINGLWLDDGTSSITASGVTYGVPGSAAHARYTDMRDFYIAQGQSSSWAYGMPYGPNSYDPSTINFVINPSYVSAGVANADCGSGNCQLIPPPGVNQGNFNPAQAGFFGRIAGFDAIPAVDFNRDNLFYRSADGSLEEHLTVHGILTGSACQVNVTRLSQGDPHWGADLYDHSGFVTIAQRGCALNVAFYGA